jgi:hypothetical protein
MVWLEDYSESRTSQHGENGIINTIFEHIEPSNKVCVEFGAYDLKNLSNVYPLWAEDDWDALLIEGDSDLYEQLQRDYNEHREIKGNVRILDRYVEPSGENSLDQILSEFGTPHNIDLISIDVDGIDYHIWKNLSDFSPRVVVIEYNWTIIPSEIIIGGKEGNDVGASLSAVKELGEQKGYDLVAVTPTNAIFVRKDESEPFETSEDIYDYWDWNERSVTYIGQTYNAEMFFSGPPAYGKYYKFANSSVNIQNEEDIYFPNYPTPDQPFKYFITYPLKYLLTHPRIVNISRRVGNKLGLKPLFRKLYKRI